MKHVARIAWMTNANISLKTWIVHLRVVGVGLGFDIEMYLKEARLYECRVNSTGSAGVGLRPLA